MPPALHLMQGEVKQSCTACAGAPLHDVQDQGMVKRKKPKAHPGAQPTRLPLRLRDYRERLGMSQAVVAARLGMSEAQVSRLERGVSVVDVQQLLDFAHLYGCEALDLLP